MLSRSNRRRVENGLYFAIRNPDVWMTITAVGMAIGCLYLVIEKLF